MVVRLSLWVALLAGLPTDLPAQPSPDSLLARIERSLDRQDTTRVAEWLSALGDPPPASLTPDQRGDAYLFRAQLLYRRKQWGPAYTAASLAREAYGIGGDPENIGLAERQLGNIGQRQNNTEQALEHFQRELTAARRSGRQEKVADALINIGSTLTRAGNFDQAATYLEESVVLTEKLGNVSRNRMALLNLAILRKRQKRFGEAISLYNQTLNLGPDATRADSVDAAYTYTNLAGLYLQRDQFREAVENGRRGLRIFERYGNARERGGARIQMAVGYKNLGRIDEAEREFRAIVTDAHEFPRLRKAALSGLVKVFADRRNIDSLIHYQRMVKDLELEEANQSRVEAIAEMEARFQNEEKQREIELLEASELLSRESIRRQRITIVAILFALGGLGFLLYRVFRQRQRIGRQNVVITRALADKEVLMKEIHHRVKNNLQMVSSLLSLQSSFVKDDIAVAALDMGKSRVRSMALIHQKLYLTDEVSTRIDARDYLTKLLGELVGNLTDVSRHVRTHTDVEQLDLDIDTMIPLGLIANELITNSLKYAFNGRDSGQLDLLLRRVAGGLEMTVRDDGNGMPSDPSADPDSFGYLLINTLTEQLEGRLRVEGHDGTTVTLFIPYE